MNALRVEVITDTDTRVLHVGAGEYDASVAAVLRQRGLPLNTRCGDRGLCEGCLFELKHGAVRHLRSGARVEAGGGPLRACEHAFHGDSSIHVPRRSVASNSPSVLEDYAIQIPWALDPLTDATWGVAIDVGTTTVAVALIELKTGVVVSRASAFNAQTHLADDVITRITLCMDNPAMVREMQRAVLEQTVAPLLRQAMNAGGAAMSGLGAMVIAGNTTMLHLLVAEDPSSLGVAPFAPRFTQHRILRAADLLEEWRQLIPDTEVHLLPGATAYVGADVVAGAIATGLPYEAEPALLVDVGTNGEIVLASDGQLVACATAAGPAFEGVRLASGMRAGEGAITRMRLDPIAGAHEFDWIGRKKRVKPLGLCGSAYIDFLAEARRCGLISTTGRFQRDAARPADWHVEAGGSLQFGLLCGPDGESIAVGECDIAALLSAKAAIAAGVKTLLQQCHLRPSDISRVFLAGGFGTRMSAANAIAIGMLPGFDVSQITPVGNSALSGAYLALVDRSLLDEMRNTATRIVSVELNLCPDFADTYIDNLPLP